MKKIALVIVVAGVVAGRALAGGPDLLDRVMAVVGGEVITLNDVRAAVDFGLVTPQAGQDPLAVALKQLINRQLMLDEVTRYAAPEPDPSVVDWQVMRIVGRFASSDAFQAACRTSGMTDERLRNLVRENLRIAAYIDQRFVVAPPSDEEIARYYSEHESQFAEKARQRPLDEVKTEVRDRLIEDTRQQMIAEWVNRLRRRTGVVEVYGG